MLFFIVIADTLVSLLACQWSCSSDNLFILVLSRINGVKSFIWHLSLNMKMTEVSTLAKPLSIHFPFRNVLCLAFVPRF
jgi:hypothetical protein